MRWLWKPFERGDQEPPSALRHRRDVQSHWQHPGCRRARWCISVRRHGGDDGTARTAEPQCGRQMAWLGLVSEQSWSGQTPGEPFLALSTRSHNGCYVKFHIPGSGEGGPLRGFLVAEAIWSAARPSTLNPVLSVPAPVNGDPVPWTASVNWCRHLPTIRTSHAPAAALAPRAGDQRCS